MAFSIHWKIIFKSLRAGTAYTANVWRDGTLPSGYPLKLKGSEEPFTTDEDDDEDMFAPIRTQSGYFRIVDDGKAVNANGQEVVFDISSLYPVTATDRPVTLTDGQGNVVWQGFMQSQTFGSELYGNPQQYEFPIQCPIAALEGKEPSTANVELRNFAYLLDQALQQLPQPVGFDTIYVQGGSDAQYEPAFAAVHKPHHQRQAAFLFGLLHCEIPFPFHRVASAVTAQPKIYENAQARPRAGSLG